MSSNPVYTHAVLTKYTSLKSFYAKLPAPQGAMVPLSYDNAGIYTATLQDAFLDYKNLAKDIHFLETEVESGAKSLKESTFSDKGSWIPSNSWFRFIRLSPLKFTSTRQTPRPRRTRKRSRRKRKNRQPSPSISHIQTHWQGSSRLDSIFGRWQMSL